MGTDAPMRRGFVRAHTAAAWEQAYLPGDGWRGPLAVVRTAGAEVAFARKRAGKLDLWALGGYYWPWRGVAVEPGAGAEALAALADELTRRPCGAMLRMGPLIDGDTDTQRFVTLLRARGWRGLKQVTGQVFELALPASAQALQAQVSGSLWKNIAYLRRRLDKQGPVITERHRLTVAQAGALLQRAALVEQASWVAQQGGDVKLVGAPNQAYWSRLAQYGDGPEVVLWLLSCGARDIAYSLHLEHGQTMCIVANGYDEEFKASSPGSLLSLDIFRDAIGRGLRLVDWGQGDSGYKQRWGALPGARMTNLILFRPGLVGAAGYRLLKTALSSWEPL
ncbi:MULTISPECIES: GNAT family N-acetyltransferase [unclassified Massilia]|uniref:GNAT family N-acetyltransferase n=1 Tax=unclassified Massilia TaxID=2609279 RepID=UPI001B81F81F|nr:MULTISPECIES: GNAT family N-acetyltransferase [unclassified Massilia]MBQ5943076.1 GNAT family N-acetyltransferase [Massilia sp. AB1]MBQ5966134.1 GNAT family N-acetyltransferase [Massilia sp. ZL223]